MLVVGATGFLGRALVRSLQERGSSTYSLLFRDRIAFDPPGEPLTAQSSQSEEISAAVRGTNWDCVYHAAAAGVSPSQRQPESLTDGNLGLLARVLKGLAACQPRRFVYVGSCAEYNRAEFGRPIAECHPTRPVNMYGAAKAAAGIWGAALAASLRIPFVLARPFHFYGAGEGPSRLIPYLIQRLRNSVEAELTAGEQVRDLLYVDDVADALIAMGSAPECPQPVYNVCSGEAISIREVGETVARVVGRPASLLRFGALPYRPDEEMWMVGDNARIKADFDWLPRASLEQGLSRVVEGSGVAR
ncbi:MAG: NAD(P)-dependent oxidoreductase [Bryobacteraceae bacterium]